MKNFYINNEQTRSIAEAIVSEIDEFILMHQNEYEEFLRENGFKVIENEN